MKLVAALTDPADAAHAREKGADLVEMRFDLMGGEPEDRAKEVSALCPLPRIATLRSVQEGGRYSGDPDEWFRKLAPVLPSVDYVDVEQRFSRHADKVKKAGKKVIASCHTDVMPDLYGLYDLERTLRTYGDVVKIIVTPQNEDDLIELISFTHTIRLPVCTGVMGPRFRYARAILPLFGSGLVYCSVGTPTSEGQYSLEEFVRLKNILGF